MIDREMKNIPAVEEIILEDPSGTELDIFGSLRKIWDLVQKLQSLIDELDELHGSRIQAKKLSRLVLLMQKYPEAELATLGIPPDELAKLAWLKYFMLIQNHLFSLRVKASAGGGKKLVFRGIVEPSSRDRRKALAVYEETPKPSVGVDDSAYARRAPGQYELREIDWSFANGFAKRLHSSLAQ